MNLLQMSLTGAVLTLAVVVIRAVAINKLPKMTFLALWWVVLFRLLVPLSLPFRFSIYTLLNRNRSGMTAANRDILNFYYILNRSNILGTDGRQTPRGVILPLPAPVFIWLVGAAAVAGIFLISCRRCHREFQTSLPVHNDTADRWLREHALRRKVEIRQLTGLTTPLTYGIFHPIILMPKNTDWQDIRQVKYMLFHEYIHICRFDVLSKIIAACAVCIHWFNPIAWVFYILFNRDIELTCDECVVRRFGGDDRADYARALIYMEEQRSGFAPFHSYFATNAIEERITAIMKMKHTTALSLALATVLVVGTITTFATSAQTRHNTSSGDSNQLSYDVTGTATATVTSSVSLTSYTDPQDGRIYYCFDNGETFTDEELEQHFPTYQVEWWTYEEYKEWLENEKVLLQSVIGETAWTSGLGEFVWTQEMVDEAIASYEAILEDIKNGLPYSKTINGNADSDIVISFDPDNLSSITSPDGIVENYSVSTIYQ